MNTLPVILEWMYTHYGMMTISSRCWVGDPTMVCQFVLLAMVVFAFIMNPSLVKGDQFPLWTTCLKDNTSNL